MGPPQAPNSDVSSALQSFLEGTFAGQSLASLLSALELQGEPCREHKDAVTLDGLEALAEGLPGNS